MYEIQFSFENAVKLTGNDYLRLFFGQWSEGKSHMFWHSAVSQCKHSNTRHSRITRNFITLRARALFVLSKKKSSIQHCQQYPKLAESSIFVISPHSSWLNFPKCGLLARVYIEEQHLKKFFYHDYVILEDWSRIYIEDTTWYHWKWLLHLISLEEIVL